MTSANIQLPGRSKELEIDDERWCDCRIALPQVPPTPSKRLVYAAAHVMMKESYAAIPHSPVASGTPQEIADHIDWDATLNFRTHLDDHGFGIAEAMDTAQRMELGWPSARRLIEQTGGLQLEHGFVAGAWTDHTTIKSPADLAHAVVEQAHVIQGSGGIPMILSMPWLSINTHDAEIYIDVYRQIIESLEGPLFIHWLGEMFAPSLKGYFPADSFERIMELDPAKVRGAKLSLLDESQERNLRRKLLKNDQIILTGDDLHFAALIEGDTLTIDRLTQIGDLNVALGDFSHALLGAFDAIAAPAEIGLQHLDRKDVDGYREIMTACEKLSRIIFEPPTQFYKVGLVFLAWLNGHQSNPMLVNHLEKERSVEHHVRMIEAAARAGALTNAPLAVERIREWLDDR